MKVSAASATMADSDIEMPATEYSTSPSEAATNTMQIAMKIVEIRITRARVLRSRSGTVPTLALLLIRQARGLLRTRPCPGRRITSPRLRGEVDAHRQMRGG